MTEAEFRALVKERMVRKHSWTVLLDCSSNTPMPSGLIGAADLLFGAPGPAVVFLETKAPGKKRTPAQVAWFKKLEPYLCDHIRYVCTDNWDDWSDAVSDLM
jgi:hypothetical protein